MYAPLEEELRAHEAHGKTLRANRSMLTPQAGRSAAGVAPAHEDEAAPSGPSMEEIFGPGGFLERSMIGGYEHRPGQLQMAEAVHDAFAKHHHSVVEAGTGTGKTLAYLMPAICSGRRVVISTATKSLQEQLYQKDIPFLQKHFAPNLKVAVMKGRAISCAWRKCTRWPTSPC